MHAYKTKISMGVVLCQNAYFPHRMKPYKNNIHFSNGEHNYHGIGKIYVKITGQLVMNACFQLNSVDAMMTKSYTSDTKNKQII